MQDHDEEMQDHADEPMNEKSETSIGFYKVLEVNEKTQYQN